MVVRSNGRGHRRPGHRWTLTMLAAGLAAGMLTGWGWLLLVPPSVPLEDYVVLVSAAFDRERLPLNAVERLSAAGAHDAASTAAAVAEEYRRARPERQRDARNVQQLAEVLKSQAAAAAPVRAGEGSDWWRWLLLAAGAAVLAVLWRRRRITPPLRSMPRAQAPQLPTAELVGGMRPKEPLGEREDGVLPATQREEHGLKTAPARSKSTRPSALMGRRRELALRPFVCIYRAGDEPFEDVHPIVHEDGDILIGACGLTAAAKLESSTPARYYAFTAWVHDYLSGEPMYAVGLLSPWASGRKRLALYDPALTRATLQRTEKGLISNMETKNLRVAVEVADLGYGTARDVPANSYFTILSVRFSVTIKG